MSNKRGRKSQQRTPQKNHLDWVRALGGPAFILGGYQIMGQSFAWGLALIYLGWLLLLLECIYENLLIRGRYLMQVCFVLAVIVGAAVFSMKVVLISAPLTVESYAMRKGQYVNGTMLPGIPWQWNPHLTDLRVFITNPTSEDYENLDFEVQPDKWNYKAAIVDDNSGCLLSSLGGNTVLMVRDAKGGGQVTFTARHVANGFEGSDSVGDVVEHFISSGGYRLRCSKFPAHLSVQIVFALVNENSTEMLAMRPDRSSLKPDHWAMRGTILKGRKNPSDLPFEILGQRPSPSIVAIHGNYVHGVKPFAVNLNVLVGDGN